MKAVKIILGIIAVIVLIFVGMGLFGSSEMKVDRSIVINAPVEQVYAHVSNLKKFNEWSPWAKMDPNAKYTFEGPDAGVGAKMSWESESSSVGVGSMKIVEAEENAMVKNEMMFEGSDKPMYASFLLSQEGDGTKVVWNMEAQNESFFQKMMAPLMKVMVGGAYDDGLSSLKELAEN